MVFHISNVMKTYQNIINNAKIIRPVSNLNPNSNILIHPNSNPNKQNDISSSS